MEMSSLEMDANDNAGIYIELDASIRDYDVAITSVDSFGSSGNLNSLVLEAFGYSVKDLPNQKDLIGGSFLLQNENKKPVLFIVTVSNDDTRENIRINLSKGLSRYEDQLNEKKIWVPLIGTGDGNLSMDEGFEVIRETLEEYLQQSTLNHVFTISFPNTKLGKEAYESAMEEKPSSLINQIIEGWIESFSKKFFVVGTIWGRQDQLPRFYEEGIWEKGQEDDKYSSIIAQIKTGDIVIAKSTFHQNKISMLRVKAIGVVKSVQDLGARVEVNWIIRDLQIDIKNLGYLRNTVHQIDRNEALKILEKTNFKTWIPLVENLNKDDEFVIAGILSDSDDGIDRLEIGNDVNAFARVIAAKSFQPPLAIALFGKWGSGKSFFMKKLMERIKRYSESTTAEGQLFCDGVVQIHFNAWSYMDTNICASIVSKIFEDLNEYITDNVKSKFKKEEIRKEIASQLKSTKEDIRIIDDQKTALEGQIETLTKDLTEITKLRNEKINEIDNHLLSDSLAAGIEKFKLIEKLNNALSPADYPKSILGDLEKLIPLSYLNDPAKTLSIVSSKITFLKAFFKSKNCLKHIIILLFSVFVLWIGIICLHKYLDIIVEFNLQIIVSITPFWTVLFVKAKRVYSEMQPIIAAVWNVQQEYEKEIVKLNEVFLNEERKNKEELAKKNKEILILEQKKHAAESLKTDLDFRLEHTLGTEAFYSFVDQRSNSEDYKKHLGIISVIRKDLEILNDLFLEQKNENESNSDNQKFRDKFEKPLERIVLYIDDLDRCPEEVVVQVLEAVNLIMAYPLFVVVVGVDYRWVKNALLKKHAIQFNGQNTMNELKGYEIIDTSNYLEKIFQIPFHMNSNDDESVRNMINLLTYSDEIEEEDSLEPTDSEGKIERGTHMPKKTGHRKILTKKSKSATYKMMQFSAKEREIMEQMSLVIGDNPRAIKRFVNIFRIIKVHEDYTLLTGFEEENLRAILFLMALSLGEYRRLFSLLFLYYSDTTNSLMNLQSFILHPDPSQEIHYLKNKFDKEILDPFHNNKLDTLNGDILNLHFPFVQRFTFESNNSK